MIGGFGTIASMPSQSFISVIKFQAWILAIFSILIDPKADVKEVNRIKPLQFQKEVTFNAEQKWKLPTSSCVDKGNRVTFDEDAWHVECHNGHATIFPTYCQKATVSVGGFSIDLLIKEITDSDELKSYQSLAGYHYKGKDLFGRTSILIARSASPYLPKVLGYIELATPFYVNKPRGEVLDAPFKHNGVHWEAWDKETTKKYINVITRIARCVVYPEFRGVGLGQMLVQHAISFAKDRWQIANWKPLFIEISADMLKYIPFAERAGLHYIGDTEGNLKRIHKDLQYLLKNYQRYKDGEIVSKHQMGIVEQQKSRLRKAYALMEEAGLTLDEFLEKLETLTKNPRLKDFTFFNGLVSLPKPTYMMGLDDIAEDFLSSRLPEVPIGNDLFHDKIRPETLDASINITDLIVSYASQIRRTHKTQALQNAFGISPSDIQAPVLHNLTLNIEPGEIVLVVGSSGAGKTTLLDFLAQKLPTSANVSGNWSLPGNYNPGVLQPIRSQKALVEYFAEDTIDDALRLMGQVGLSDAFVFAKRFDELSNGQKYRAQIASLIKEKRNVMIADEFCANLDPISANVLAHRLQKLARRLGITVVLGAAHCENFLHSLQPDKVIRLSTAWDFEVSSGSEFAANISSVRYRLGLPSMRLKREYFDLVACGKKSSSIRKGEISVSEGLNILECGSRVLPVYVKTVDHVTYGRLTLAQARRDGFNTLKELKTALTNIYGPLSKEDKLSIVEFALLNL